SRVRMDEQRRTSRSGQWDRGERTTGGDRRGDRRRRETSERASELHRLELRLRALRDLLGRLVDVLRALLEAPGRGLASLVACLLEGRLGFPLDVLRGLLDRLDRTLRQGPGERSRPLVTRLAAGAFRLPLQVASGFAAVVLPRAAD